MAEMQGYMLWFMLVKVPIWEVDVGILQIQGQPGQLSETLSQSKFLKGWDYSSVVEHCLSNMYVALGSVPSTTSESERREDEEREKECND